MANQWLAAPPGNPFVSTVRVQGGPDVADQHIAEHAEPGGPRPYGPKDKQAFAAALDRVLTRALRGR